MPSSPSNRYGTYGSPYSVDGARNPYTSGGLNIIGADGEYLGNLNANPYDPNSVANPYGRYGSPFGSTSINNPYGKYGSPYSSYSATNPYATQAPTLVIPRVGYPAAVNTSIVRGSQQTTLPRTKYGLKRKP